MLTSDVAFGHSERHHVLQLITEAIGSARLIEGCPCPHPAGKRLVEQPAIHQNIHRPVRRGDLYGAEHLVPLLGNLEQNLVEVRSAIATDQLPGLFPVPPLTQEKYDFSAFTGTQLKQRLQRSARVEPRTHSARNPAATLKW